MTDTPPAFTPPAADPVGSVLASRVLELEAEAEALRRSLATEKIEHGMTAEALIDARATVARLVSHEVTSAADARRVLRDLDAAGVPAFGDVRRDALHVPVGATIGQWRQAAEAWWTLLHVDLGRTDG